MATVESQELRMVKVKAIMDLMTSMNDKQLLGFLSAHGLLLLRKEYSLALSYLIPGLLLVALFVPSTVSILAPVTLTLFCLYNFRPLLERPYKAVLPLLCSIGLYLIVNWVVVTAYNTPLSYHYIGLIFVVIFGLVIDGIYKLDYALKLVDKGVSPEDVMSYLSR